MDTKALSDQDLALLTELKSCWTRPEETLARHLACVRSLRDELAKLTFEVEALVTWDSPERGELSMSLDILPGGRADLGPAFDHIFDVCLAQALEADGALVLSKAMPVRIAGGPARMKVCGVALDHGTWRYADGDRVRWS